MAILVEQDANVTCRMALTENLPPCRLMFTALDKEAKSTLQTVSMILDDLWHCIKRPSFSLDFIGVSKYSRNRVNYNATNCDAITK
ncbi:hypothetical protein [Collimonas pratensis]|uniref:hypothetical protein n=1 Tax=Collimonas pratensis TaxID=279113 RepID=UPI001237832C|nr:hypothetical protein [Collimonas pratensis]